MLVVRKQKTSWSLSSVASLLLAWNEGGENVNRKRIRDRPLGGSYAHFWHCLRYRSALIYLSVHSRDLLECRVSIDRESNILGPSKLWTDLSSRDPPDIIEPCLLILNRTVCCCGYRALQMTRFLEPFSRSVPLAVWKGSGTQANHLACFPMGTVLAIEAASARQSH